MTNDLEILGLLAVTLVACDNSATCAEVSRTAVSDPGAPVIIGGSYGDVLTTVVGTGSGTMQWLESEPHVSGFPSPGEAQITVTVHEPTLALPAWPEEGGLS